MEKEKKWKITNTFNKVQIYVNQENNLQIIPNGFMTFILGKKKDFIIPINEIKQIVISEAKKNNFGYFFITNSITIDFDHLATYSKLTNFIVLQWDDEYQLAKEIKKYCQNINNNIK